MDPFSFAASVLAVVEIVHKITVAIARYSIAVREAHESRQRFLAELGSLSVTLTNIQFQVDGWSDSGGPDDRRVMMFGPELTLCKDTLDGLLNWLSREGGGQMRTAKRLMWPLREARKIAHFLEKLQRHRSQLNLALGIVSTEMLGNLQGVVLDVAAEQKRVDMQSVREEHEKTKLQYIEHLDPVNYKTRHKNVSRVRQKDTCKWLFENPAFTAWRTCSAFLWLYGIPGSGKTVLASAVINELQQHATTESAILYFYCDFRETKAGTTIGVLRTLIAQVLRDDRIDYERDLPDLSKFSSKGSASLTDIDDLYAVVVKACQLFKTTLVVDALDECEDYAELVSLLLRLHKEASVSVFTTSRKEQAIYNSLESLPKISLREEVKNVDSDIAKHVAGELQSKSRLSRLPAELKDEVVSTLLSRSGGMFRWVQCQLDIIAKCLTQKGINEALGNLPKGLYETYERVLARIHKEGTESSQIAHRSLIWLVAAGKPMTLVQIVEAIIIQVGETCLDEESRVFDATAILDICGCLVDFDTNSQVVSLSHFTVKEYLIGDHLQSASLGYFRISPCNSQRVLAMLTLTYLLLDSFREGPYADLKGLQDRVNDHPLFEYATLFWHRHMGQTPDEDDAFFRCLEDFLLDKSNRQNYFAFRQLFTYLQSGRKQFTSGSAVQEAGPLWYLISCGRPWVARRMLDAHPDLVHCKLQSGGTPLMLAASKGRTEVVRFLLDAGAPVDQSSLDFCGNKGKSVCPSYLAVKEGRNATFDLLVERGADINYSISPQGESLLHCAANTGNLHIVRALVERGVDVAARSADGSTALHQAVRGGSLDVVHALVKAGCNAQAQTHARRRPLEFALDLHCGPIVDFLLENGADVSDIQTAIRDDLDWAAGESWYPTVIDGFSRLQGPSALKLGALDVLKVRHLLHKRLDLPMHAVLVILDLADYWICSAASREFVEPLKVNECSPQRPFVSVRVKGAESSKVRRVVFTVKSHDQGWSDFRKHHGTFRCSWTWHDAGRTRGDEGTSDSDWSIEHTHRRKITENVHASSTFRVQRHTWDHWDRTPGVREWLDGITAGDRVHIFPRARFRGWVNFVESGGIETYVSL